MGNSIQVTFYKCYFGTLHGNICSCTHCYPNVGLGKCRCIINTIAGHCYNVTLFLQFFNFIVFIIRQTIGFEAIEV